MEFSVLITNQQSEKTLGKTLETICSQNRRPKEIIVIDEANLSEEFLSRWKQIAGRLNIAFVAKQKDPAVPLSILSLVTTDHLIRLQSTSFLLPKCFEYLTTTRREHEDPQLLGVGGVIMNEGKGTWLNRAWRFFFGLRTKHPFDFTKIGLPVSSNRIENVTKGFFAHSDICMLHIGTMKQIQGGTCPADFFFQAKQSGFHMMIDPRAKIFKSQTKQSRKERRAEGKKEMKENLNRYRVQGNPSIKNHIWFTWSAIGIVVQQIFARKFSHATGLLLGLFTKQPPTHPVLFIITSSYVGGAQRYVIQLSDYQKKLGHNVRIACGPKGDWLPTQTNPEVPFDRIPLYRSWNPLRSVQFLIYLFFYLRKHRPSIVHFNSSHPMIGLWITKLMRIPSVATVHGLSYLNTGTGRSTKTQIAYKWFMRLTFPFADHVSFECEADRNAACPVLKLHKQQTSISYNGFGGCDFLTKEEARKKLDLPQDKLILGSLGRFAYQKNHKLMLEAFAKLNRKDILLCLIGEGPLEEEVKEQAKTLGINDQVLFRTGNATILKALDLFIMSSRFEGFSCVLLETAAAGVPIVSTYVGGILELLEPNVSANLAERTPEALSNAINDLVNNPDKRKTYAEKAQKQALTQFTEDRLCRDIEMVYKILRQKNSH